MLLWEWQNRLIRHKKPKVLSGHYFSDLSLGFLRVSGGGVQELALCFPADRKVDGFEAVHRQVIRLCAVKDTGQYLWSEK